MLRNKRQKMRSFVKKMLLQNHNFHPPKNDVIISQNKKETVFTDRRTNITKWHFYEQNTPNTTYEIIVHAVIVHS